MCKLASVFTVLVAVLLASCARQDPPNERADKAYWGAALIDSSYCLLYKDKDTTRALHYYDSVLQRLDPQGNCLYPKAARFDLLANYHYFFTNYNATTAKMIDAALALYSTKALQNSYPRTCVHLLLFGGQIAYRLAEYGKANDYYFRAKKLGDAELSPCERTPFNYNIAMVAYRQENYAQSLGYFTEAYSLQETCAPQTTAVVLQQQEIQSNIGLCLFHLGQYDRAITHFDKALQIAERYKDSLGPVTIAKIYGVVYGNKAQVAFAKNRLAEAEEFMQKSLALTDREGYEPGYAQGVKLQLAALYDRKNDYTAMAGVLRNADTAKLDAAQQSEWNRLMAHCYERTGHTDAALQFFKRYSFLRDSLSEGEKRLLAADVARQLYNKEQEVQLTVLKKDHHLTLMVLAVTVLLSAMALVILGLIYLNYRRSKKNLAESLALNEEIRKQKAAREEEVNQRHKLITEAVIQAQESERSLIGLELHDNVCQVLTTVKLHNEMLLDGVADSKVLLPRTLKYLQDCIDEIRSLSKQLSAPTLGKISLEDSVKELIDSINQTNRVKITHSIQGFEQKAFGREVHIGVYRILQEQLNNVVKHAEASEVLVRLKREGDQLLLSVSDNGKGFTAPGNKGGIGLINMQTRAENLNGTFSLQSEPGKGCKLEVLVPCINEESFKV